MTRAVVFAYHNVGVRCLKVLLGYGVDVALVVTHRDNPNETIWFSSVQQLAKEYQLPVIMPDDPNDDEVVAAVRAVRPDFLFSFYYRSLLKESLLMIPSRGAYNMHGSLLPKYRGRVPINWAIIHGEVETGATLHVMNTKPDNGPLIDQYAVPILPDDNAQDVFDKVTVAAEITLWRSLPGLIRGERQPVPQDLSLGAYFGGRRPEDGRIDSLSTAKALHNFVRALTHPFPGAFADTLAGRLVVWKTRVAPSRHDKSLSQAQLVLRDDQLVIDTVEGGSVFVLDAHLNEEPLNSRVFVKRVGERILEI